METKVNYRVAGVFVIALIASIVLAIIWLSSGLNTEEYVFYRVFMKESVSGLNQDGSVEFNGVTVGNVSKMKINRDNPRIVALTLKIKKDTPITEGTRAKLGMRALTGTAYILLEDDGLNMTPLKPKEEQKYAVIETSPSLYVRLETALTQLNDNFQQLSKSMQLLLNDTNLQNFQKILQSSQITIRLLETQTIPAINQTVSNLNDVTNTLSDVVSDVKQNPAVLIRGKQSMPLGPGEK